MDEEDSSSQVIRNWQKKNCKRGNILEEELGGDLSCKCKDP